MAGVKGKSGRHESDIKREGCFFRLRPEVITRVERCTPLLIMQEGVRMSKAEALEHLLTMACEALERTREGRETPAPTSISRISEISSRQISKISEISGEDISVPGYGFLEDPEDEAETPGPGSHTNGMQVLELGEVLTEAAAFLEDEDDEAPAEPVLEQTPSTKTPALPEDIVKIAEARAQYDKLGERPFAQLLFDRGIYRHRTKDGREVPIPHTTLREWLQRARDAGVL